LRFGHWFGVDPEFWINLQAQFELATAAKEIGEAIRQLPTKASLPTPVEQPRLV
jgi:plasmid maintenance system antidote protein VapI